MTITIKEEQGEGDKWDIILAQIRMINKLIGEMQKLNLWGRDDDKTGDNIRTKSE